MCHFYNAGLPPQCLVKLQLWDQLCIDTCIVQQPIMPGFRSQVCRLFKLKFRDCPNTASGAASCWPFSANGGERAGAIAGAVVRSLTCSSVCRTGVG